VEAKGVKLKEGWWMDNWIMDNLIADSVLDELA
jgi:hypothetical protein